MIKEILERFNNFAFYGTLVLIFLCFIIYNAMYLLGNPNRKSELKLYDVLVLLIITIVVINIVLLLYSYLSTKRKKGLYGAKGIEGAPGEKGEVGVCNTDCGKKVCIGSVLEQNNKYLNQLLYKITDKYIPFSNHTGKKIEKIKYGMTLESNVIDRKTRIPSRLNDRALAVFSNDKFNLNENDVIHYVNFGIHDKNVVDFPFTNIGSIKVKENFVAKIIKTTGEELVFKPGEYDRLDLDDKNLDKSDTIEKIVIETEIQNKFFINKLNKICHSDNYQKMLERPGSKKINEKKLITYITDITKKWIKHLYDFKIKLSIDERADEVYAGLRFLLEPNFKIEMFKKYRDSNDKIINNPFYNYTVSKEDDTKFVESKGEILKYDIWNWSEKYYTNKPVIKKCFDKQNLPVDDPPELSIKYTNDYIPKYTAEAAPDLFNTFTCPHDQVSDKNGFPTNPKEKTHCIYLEPEVSYTIDKNGKSTQHVRYTKKIAKAWKDKKVYKPENEVSLYHPKSFTDKDGRKYYPVGSVWTGTNDVNKPKFADHTPESNSSCSSHSKYGPKKQTILVSGNVKPPLSYRELWSSKDTTTEEKQDVKVKGAVLYSGEKQDGTNAQIPNSEYTKLQLKKLISIANSVIVKPDHLLKIDYVEDDGTKGFDEYVRGGHTFDNYRQYNKENYKFQFIPSNAKTTERNFPPIKNGNTYYILSMNYNNGEFHFLRDRNGVGEITTTPKHSPLQLFKHTNYRGLRLDFQTGQQKVGALFDQASSFKIARGYFVKFCDWNGGSTESSCWTGWHPSRSTRKAIHYGPKDASTMHGLKNDNLDFVSVRQIPDLYFYGSTTEYNNMKMTINYKDDYYFSIRSGNGRYLNLQNGINFVNSNTDKLEFYEHNPAVICIRSVVYNKLLYFDSNGIYMAKPFTSYIDLTSKLVLQPLKTQFALFKNNENKYLQDNGKLSDVSFKETEMNPFQRTVVKYYKNGTFSIQGRKNNLYLTSMDNGKLRFVNNKIGENELFMFYNETSTPFKTEGIPLSESDLFIKSFKTDRFLGIDSEGKLVLDTLNKLNAMTFKVLVTEIDDSIQNSIYSNIKIWRPEDPPGYKCLGDVVTTLDDEPKTGNNASIMCVPEDCVSEVPIINQFYNNKNFKVEINKMDSDGNVYVTKEKSQKPMELYSCGSTGAFEENRHREEQDYMDDGGHNLFRFSEKGVPNKNLALKINKGCLKNRIMKPITPKNPDNVLDMINENRNNYKKTVNYFSYPIDAFIENRRIDDTNKIINDNKSYYLQYATDKPLSKKQIQINNQKMDTSPKERGEGLYFLKTGGKDRNEFDNCLVVENGKLVKSDICNSSNKNHLWELMDMSKFEGEQLGEDVKFSHKDKTAIELRSMSSDNNRCFHQDYNDKGIINEALSTCKQKDKNKFSWMYRSINSNDSNDSFEDSVE